MPASTGTWPLVGAPGILNNPASWEFSLTNFLNAGMEYNSAMAFLSIFFRSFEAVYPKAGNDDVTYYVDHRFRHPYF